MDAKTQPQVTPERLTQLAWGYAAPLIMEAAVRHGVFDYLDKGPATLEETATATGASVRGLRAIMNALVGIQLLAKSADGRYSLTPESAAFLVSSKPGYLGGLLRHTSTQIIPRWLDLGERVRTGKPPDPVNEETTGAGFFHDFVADIFPLSYPSAKLLAATLGLAESGRPVRVLDLAAGSGVWGIALAQASPQVTVTAVDWPSVLDVTRRMAARFGLGDRFTYVPGDLDDADFGTGHNVATLGQILHSQGESGSRALLHKTFGALAPGGTIAIAEFLVEDDRTGPPMGLIFAVNMLVATDEGDTFSFRQISSWLEEAGFRDARTVAAPGPSPLILATRP